MERRERPPRESPSIVGRCAFFFPAQQPCFNENLQVVTQCTLASRKNIAELRDAEGVLCHNAQDIETERITCRFEQGSQRRCRVAVAKLNDVGGRFHGRGAYQRPAI